MVVSSTPPPPSPSLRELLNCSRGCVSKGFGPWKESPQVGSNGANGKAAGNPAIFSNIILSSAFQAQSGELSGVDKVVMLWLVFSTVWYFYHHCADMLTLKFRN
mmetsp:Transcript_17793/g.35669  ORF Transcript_17793/g.35669 Transcript_17793/m.35669 type:complete len:104 (-) Transcript_17793:62-373(-)